MPSRHRSAYRRRQGSQARRRTAITIAIPLALAVVVGGVIAFTDGLTSHVSNAALNCASPAAYVLPAKAADGHHSGYGGGGTAPATAGAGTATSATTAAPTGAATPTTAATGAATPTTAATGAATPTTAATGAATPTTAATGAATPTTAGTATATATATATGSATAAPTSPPSGVTCASASATATTGTAAAANVNCDIIVPANPLSAKGLATPYQLTGPDGMTPDQSGCTMTNATALGAFVQATILDARTGKLYVYNPLVITQGTTPAVAPVVPALPRNAVVTIEFGFNGTVLTQVGATRGALRQGNCVNGLDGSPFGQVSFCNGTSFFRTAFALEREGKLRVPSAGTSAKIVASGGDLGSGQACPTSRNFDMIDQDQSDNVTATYLLNANGQTAQNNAANAGNLPGATTLANGSDNILLAAFLDPTLGCTPFTAPDLGNNNQPATSQALDELSAARSQPAIPALVPENDEMVLNAQGNTDQAKTNLYRSEVGQPPVSAANDKFDSPANYCQNMVNIQTPFLQANQALLATGPTPVPGVGSNLFTFLANRLSMSFTNLGCQKFGLTNPVTVTLDGNGAAVAATFNTAVQAASGTAANGGGAGAAPPPWSHRHGRKHHEYMDPSGA